MCVRAVAACLGVVTVAAPTCSYHTPSRAVDVTVPACQAYTLIPPSEATALSVEFPTRPELLAVSKTRHFQLAQELSR